MEYLLENTIEITRSAGITIMKYYKTGYSVKNKSPDNPVTDADYAADRLLRQKLSALIPEAGWLSEESTDWTERLQKDLVWIVDPLDGTKEFIKGTPEFSVSVALAEKGEPVLGVIYNPASEELFYGMRNGGVFSNGVPVRVTKRTQLEGALIDASHSESERGEFDPFSPLLEIHPVGSTAYKLARVAAGLCDASWSRGPKNEWDVCAGTLLVVEAGGNCVDLENAPFTFNLPDPLVKGFIADNGCLHDNIMELLAPYEAVRI